MADHAAHRASGRDAVVWRSLRAALAHRRAETGRECLEVVDVGGGTGNVAVPLAELGHRITVVDPSPNSLAALDRRAGDAGVQDLVHSVQADLADLATVAGPGGDAGAIAPGGYDVAVCHSVLEYVDDPAASLTAVGRLLADQGVLSVVVANRHAVVLAKVVAGHVRDAHRSLVDPDGRWGPADPVPRRFTAEELQSQLYVAGFTATTVQGTQVFADLVPGSVAEEPGAEEALRSLEAVAGSHPAFRAIATQLHAVARKG